MTQSQREQAQLRKLVKLAKATADESQRRVADLEAARASAEASRDWLAQNARAEEARFQATSGSDIAALHDYKVGVSDQRQSLDSTIQTLDAEIIEARAALSEAYTEVKKLEHILDVRARTEKMEFRRREAEAGDECSRRAIR